MIYPALGAVTAASFYLGMQAAQRSRQEKAKEVAPVVRVEEKRAEHSFREGTIGDYIERRQEENKFVVYSKHHQCALATHQYIDKKTLEKEEAAKLSKLVASNLEAAKVNEAKPDNTANETVEASPTQVEETTPTSEEEEIPIGKYAITNQLYTKVFTNYAKELLTSSTCDSVQLISGPIFSKDTPFKQNKEIVRSVFTTNPRVTPKGEHITDRYYTFVVCNRASQHYWAGFTHRRSHFKNYRLLNFSTSLKKIEEMTGLAFQISGKQLTFVDYAGMSKERLFADLQPKVEQTAEPSKQPETPLKP